MKIFHFNDEEKELHRFLAERGHENTILPASANPFRVVRNKPFDAAFVGLHPHGLKLIKDLHAGNPECLVTIITSDRNTRMAVEAMKTGAFDYLLSPLDFREVERTYILLERERHGQSERRQLHQRLEAAGSGKRMIGTSEAIERLRHLVAKAAATKAPALILGETGTGKELIARLLGETGPRASKPFVSLNCNAIPGTLMESELFGYKKGAFTGADADHEGLLAQAEGGTFFFDEIQDIEISLQGKILRVLQENELRPVGGRTSHAIDVRFIAATNENLPALIGERKFRRDLYYRLNVLPIQVPPLRERREDIPLLARHFLDLHAKAEAREPLKLAPEVLRWMMEHAWPGNIRELENLCQRAVALAEGDTFSAALLALSKSYAPSVPVPSRENGSNGDYRTAHAQLDAGLFEQVLAEHGGNVSRTAEALGISRTTLYAKARRLGLQLERIVRPVPR